jgi:hypothetical protein
MGWVKLTKLTFSGKGQSDVGYRETKQSNKVETSQSER